MQKRSLYKRIPFFYFRTGKGICSFFSTARRTNQEAPPLLSGCFARPLLPPSGAAELASLRQSSPLFFRRQASSRPDKGGFPCRTCLLLFSSTPLLGTGVPRCLPYIADATQGRSLKPPRLRHSPYIPLRGTQRESLNVPSCRLQETQRRSLNVSICRLW